LRAENQLSDRN
jgi:hypothetical protein